MLLLWLSALFIPGLRAQEYHFRKYTIHDGLPNSNVFRIFQDKRGFLWFSTNYGLGCFDGKSFRNYYSRDGLSDNCIMSVSEDEKGIKYVSTYGGGINIITDTSVCAWPAGKGKLPRKILYTFPYKNNIWAIGIDKTKQLYRIRDGQTVLENLRSPDGKPVGFHKPVITGGELFFATTNGIYRVDDQDRVVPFLDGIIREEVVDLKKDYSGNYWIGMEDRVAEVRGDTVKQIYPLAGSYRTSNLLVDRNNIVWVATLGEGILFIKNNRLVNLNEQLRVPRILINDLFEDSEGNIWVATHGEGVHRINSLDVINYPVEKNKINVYCKSITNCSDSELLIGSIGMVSKWQNGQLFPLSFRQLAADQFIYFIRVIDSNIYVGTPTTLIARSMQHPYRERILHNTGTLSFLKDSRNSTWLGSYSHLYRLKGDTFVPDTSSPLLYNRRYNTIIEARDGTIWFGTDSGLISYSGGVYRHQLIGRDPALNHILQLYEDSYGRLWAATEGGLGCLYRGQKTIFTTKNGLPGNKCNTIAEDRNHTLWIGTVNGLCYLQPGTREIREYRVDVYSNEVLSLFCHDSILFVGTENGMSLIQTKLPYVDDIPLPLYIMSASTDKQQLHMPTALRLPYNDNKLSVEFIGISYRHADMVEYRYKLEGLNDKWHITKNNAIELNALPSGSYQLLLSARQNKGSWSPDVALSIYVATPFWKTWWFISCAAIGLFLISRRQVMRYAAKKRQQLVTYNKITYLKQQALSALINPHFIFNCMNSIQHYLNKHDNDLANQYLADFACLIRATMENAQEAFIGLDKEISRIQLYLSLEKLRCGEYLRYQIVTDPELNLRGIRIPNMILQPYIENAIWHGIMPKNCPGDLSVFFLKNTETEIKIIIQDNGIGLHGNKSSRLDDIEIISDNELDDIISDSTSAARRSLGMSLTRERLDLLRNLLGQYYTVSVKETADEQGMTTGTLVEIILPVTPDEQTFSLLEEAGW